MRVAITHNLRPHYVAPDSRDDTFEEHDTQETIAAVSNALEKSGVEPVPVVADRDLPRRLADGQFDFVFNVADGEGHRCREAMAAMICEMLGAFWICKDHSSEYMPGLNGS